MYYKDLWEFVINVLEFLSAAKFFTAACMLGDLASQDCLLGMEFSGRDESGSRVMGLLAAKGLASVVDAHRDFLWSVPEDWTLEQAATVPVAYATAFYALVVRGHIRAGETVLIHSGSGAVGQAAISIALRRGCHVLTTVGSESKRKYLQQRFPELDDSCFANSRDSNFWQTLRETTEGRGVDVVLNSLAEDKLQSSVQLLAQHGRFLEIGKYDLSNNTSLGMLVDSWNETLCIYCGMHSMDFLTRFGLYVIIMKPFVLVHCVVIGSI